MTTLRDLADKAARRGLAKTDRPVTMKALAERCGMSKQQFHLLLAGRSSSHGTRNEPPDWTVEKLARGLGYTAETIRRAHKASRDKAERDEVLS